MEIEENTTDKVGENDETTGSTKDKAPIVEEPATPNVVCKYPCTHSYIPPHAFLAI